MIMNGQTDLNVFLEKLLCDDEEAWLLLKSKTEEFLQKSSKFNEILTKNSYSRDDFINALIVHLKEDDKRRLRQCRDPNAFWGWLNRVEQTVLYKLTKDSLAFLDGNREQDEEQDDDGNPALLEKSKENFERDVRRADSFERLQITRTIFAKLWKEDPQSCFVMFARFELELSSRDVGAFLGISANHVDVMVNRARGKLRSEESKIL